MMILMIMMRMMMMMMLMMMIFSGDGLIQEAELQHVMRACMDENGMSFDEESVEELTRALYQVMMMMMMIMMTLI